MLTFLRRKPRKTRYQRQIDGNIWEVNEFGPSLGMQQWYSTYLSYARPWFGPKYQTKEKRSIGPKERVYSFRVHC